MKKYFKMAWIVVFVAWLLAALSISAIIYIDFYRSGFIGSYMNFARNMWTYANNLIPAYKYVMFGFIFFPVTMFLVVDD